MVGRYLGHVAESFHKRDAGMAGLVANLSVYSDTPVLTPDGGGAIALARPAGDGELVSVSTTPFRIVVRVDPGSLPAIVWQYRVLPGTIVDGTNGTSVPIVADWALWTAIAEGYVVINMEISELEIVLAAVGVEVVVAAPNEVVLSGELQTEANLLLGKITSLGPGLGYAASQACFTSQICTHAFLNGATVRVFESAPTHPDEL